MQPVRLIKISSGISTSCEWVVVIPDYMPIPTAIVVVDNILTAHRGDRPRIEQELKACGFMEPTVIESNCWDEGEG